jgi:hypothetical protein
MAYLEAASKGVSKIFGLVDEDGLVNVIFLGLSFGDLEKFHVGTGRVIEEPTDVAVS